MDLRIAKVGALILAFSIFLAMIIPCISVLHNTSGDMPMNMRFIEHEIPCCAVQPRPVLDNIFTASALPELSRNIFLLLTFFVTTLIIARRRINLGITLATVPRIRSFELLKLQRNLSDIDKALRWGVLQPRVYDPVLAY